MPDTTPTITARSGVLLVVCAPSGTGKTTLIQRLRDEFPNFAYSISCTTRAPRGHETNGEDYHFLSVEEFLRRREAGFFAEWANVHGNYYGTPLAPVLETLKAGQDVLFDIDVQGAAKVHELCKTNEIFRDCVEFVSNWRKTVKSTTATRIHTAMRAKDLLSNFELRSQLNAKERRCPFG